MCAWAALAKDGDVEWSRQRRVLVIAVPAMGTLIADPLLGLVDTAVVGRLGAAELGALGLAVAVFTTLSWVFNFLVFGTTSTVARAVGASRMDIAARRVSHAIQVAVVLGVVVGGLLLVFAPLIIRSLGAVDALIEPASTYLSIRAIGVPLLLLGYVGHGAFRGVADTKTPLFIVIGANLINAVLTVTFVFGFGLGIAGAAWGTVLAELFVVVAFAVRWRRTGLVVTGHGRPGKQELLALLFVSRDLFLRTGALLTGLLIVTVAAARIDADTAAAHHILYQLFLLIAFTLDGLGIAGQTLVGRALGAGDEAEARRLAREFLWWGVGTGVVVGVVLLAGMAAIPRVLTDDQSVIAMARTAWIFVAVMQPLNGAVFSLEGIMMGAEDFRFLRNWTLLAAISAAVTSAVVVWGGFGVLGLWVAMEVLMLLRFVPTWLRLRGDRWLTFGVAS